MLLSDVDFNHITEYFHPDAWSKGDLNLVRRYYFDDFYFYKIWGPKYHVKNLILEGDRFILYPEVKTVAVDFLNFLDEENSPALVDFIYDENNICRGYKSIKGMALKNFNEVPDYFLDSICKKTLETGVVLTDFCPNNTIKLSTGIFSLIDFDSVPARSLSFNKEFQLNNSLRDHIFPRYRSFLLDNLSNS